jgi:hypothetical protein
VAVALDAEPKLSRYAACTIRGIVSSPAMDDHLPTTKS